MPTGSITARSRGALRDPHLPVLLSVPVCATPIWAQSYHVPFASLFSSILMPSDGMASRHIALDLQTQCKEYFTSVYKKNCVNPHVNKKGITDLFINYGGVNSTNTMCKVVFFSLLTHCFAMYITFRVALPRHSWSLYGELSFGFPSDAAVPRPNIL